MFTTSIIAVVATLAIGIYGQPTETVDGSWPEVREATTTDSAVPTHTIAVGAEGFKFSPNNINATVGSILEFRFYPGGHTVARADFKNPCIPYEYTEVNRMGFFSGQISPQVISNNLPAYQVRVNNTEPIFFYCTAPGSCFQQHMIGVVNPNSTQTLDLQMQYALNATYQLEPGQPFPSETLAPTSTPTPGASDPQDDDHHHLSAGAIAGIAIGGAAVLVLAGALVFLCGRRGGLNMGYRRSTAAMQPPMVDAQYAPEHKSPGQGMATHHYSGPIGGDAYRTNSPHTYASSPPPMSPNHQAYATYSTTGGYPHAQSPLMAGSTDGTQGYYPAASPPPVEMQHHMQIAPVELPTSPDPGHSPLPSYQQPGRQYSWSQGQETQYRPGSKA